MMRLKTLLLLGISLTLVSCGGQQTTTTPEASPTTEASPTATASPEAAASPTGEASPEAAASPTGTTKVMFIPVATFVLIDANKDGSVTMDEYVEYYTEKAEPKVTKEEATKNFEALMPKDGKITKDMAK